MMANQINRGQLSKIVGATKKKKERIKFIATITKVRFNKNNNKQQRKFICLAN